MKALLQRVSSSSVDIDGKTNGRIGKGLLILLGVGNEDCDSDTAFLADKCVHLRIFNDDAGKMNLSLLDIKGEALIISQFTLYADSRKGRRPSYTDAAPPSKAIPLYEKFVESVKNKGVHVQTGVFGAKMKVTLVNDGPVTILLDSKS